MIHALRQPQTGGGLEASRDGASLFFGPAGAGGWGCGGGPDLPVGGQDVHGQRRQRREVVAGFWRGSPRSRISRCGVCSRSWPIAAWWWLLCPLWHFLQHEGVTFKKAFAPQEQDRPDVARRRERVEGASGDDRSEAACVYRRDLGENQHDALPWPMRQRRSASSLQSALRAMANPHVHGGAALRPAHRALRHRRTDQWRKLLRLCRASSRPGPRARRYCRQRTTSATAIRAAPFAPTIRAAKAKLFFLPAYSPDLNPIEQAFAKMKTLLRKADARTIDETWRTIGALLDCFTPKECANYFRNAGYASA